MTTAADEHGARCHRSRRDECGTVSAETAMVIPILAVLAVGLSWLVSLGVTQVRVVDAAREAARVVARGESTGNAVELGRRIAPEGSRVRVQRGKGTVTVTVTTPMQGPGGLFSGIAGFEIDASAVAAREPGS